MQGQDRDQTVVLHDTAQKAHGLELVADVEAARWFVHQHDGRLLGQGPCDDHALSLSTAQLVDGAEREVVQSHQVQGFKRNVPVGFADPHPGVWDPAHHDRIDHGDRKHRPVVLRDVAHVAGQRPPRHAPHVFTFVADRACLRVVDPIEAFEQRRLSRPVRPHDRQNLSPLGLEADAFQHLPPAVGVVHAVHGKTHPEYLVLRAMTRLRKSGTPRNEMTIPTGMTTGESSVRPIVSESTTRMAPMITEKGRSRG